jgi:hypothetical protein
VRLSNAPVWIPVTTLALLTAACSQGDRLREITSSRTVEAADADIVWNASVEQRFGLRRTEGAPGGGSGGFHAQTPPGWQELPTSSLRLVNLRVAGDERAECYLTVLGGDGGGLAANVNRWRKQMSLPEASAEEIAALPRANLLGAEALLVDIEGVWTGMSGDEEGTDYRLVGLAQVTGGAARFLKMTGPRDVLAGEVEAFLTLAASMHVDDGSHSHGDTPAAPGLAAAPAGGDSSALRWQDPPGWRRGPARVMREVTFFIGEDDTTECYVSILKGDGGGISANVNRWCEQMGAAPLTEAELDGATRITMLGSESVLVEVDGTYEGMGDANVPGAKLLGAVCLLGESSVFVKMIGPSATVAGEREAFVAFCESIVEGN